MKSLITTKFYQQKFLNSSNEHLISSSDNQQLNGLCSFGVDRLFQKPFKPFIKILFKFKFLKLIPNLLIYTNQNFQNSNSIFYKQNGMRQDKQLKQNIITSQKPQKFKQRHRNTKQKSNYPIKRQFNQKKSIFPLIKINGELNQQDYNLKKEQKSNLIDNKKYTREQKTRGISKKKIKFQINYSNYQKQYQNFGHLFVHTLKNLTCDQKFLEVDVQDPATRNFPSSIVNILYGQHIHNYNPYIEALDELYDEFRGKVSKEKIQRIKKLCHIGIAKNFFKSQKYSETPKYRRVNILIRTYMYDNMRNIVEQKAENYENIVFIPCNKGSLSFSYKKFPQQLQQICNIDFYQGVIENVNKIIETQYINYKKINAKRQVTDKWSQNFVYFLTCLFFIIFIFTNSIILTYILAFFILVSIILYVVQSRQTLSMLGSSKSIIHKIQISIENYLKEINSHNMEWKVGQDFYWLEIHYIRKRKKKNKLAQ